MLPGFLVGALALQIRGPLDASVDALGAGPGGRLAERTGALRARTASALVSCVCLSAAGLLAQSLVLLFACLVIAGLANAVAQPAINLFMADQVPLARQGLAFGIKQAAIPAAVLVSGLALPLLALPLGWRPTFAICAAGVLAVAVAVRRSATSFAPVPRRDPAPPPSRALIVTALGAALASAGPNALGAYLVASAVDVGIAEGVAGLLAAAGNGAALLTRVALGERADRRRDYGYATVVALLVSGSLAFALLASGEAALFVIGVFGGFALGWGWPGLFNLAVVHLNRDAPGAATGVTQTGIYVGAAAGPAAYGLVSQEYGYSTAWVVSGVLCLLAAVTFWYAERLARSHVPA